jgi:hypothetical protein
LEKNYQSRSIAVGGHKPKNRHNREQNGELSMPFAGKSSTTKKLKLFLLNGLR